MQRTMESTRSLPRRGTLYKWARLFTLTRSEATRVVVVDRIVTIPTTEGRHRIYHEVHDVSKEQRQRNELSLCRATAPMTGAPVIA